MVSRLITLSIHLALPPNTPNVVFFSSRPQIIDLYFLSLSGGVMIYFDRIEVVNYLIPSAGNPHQPVCLSSTPCSFLFRTWSQRGLVVPGSCVFSFSELFVFPLCSIRHSEELHSGLRQSSDLQQGPPRAQSVLQRSLVAGGVYRLVW